MSIVIGQRDLLVLFYDTQVKTALIAKYVKKCISYIAVVGSSIKKHMLHYSRVLNPLCISV